MYESEFASRKLTPEEWELVDELVDESERTGKEIDWVELKLIDEENDRGDP